MINYSFMVQCIYIVISRFLKRYFKAKRTSLFTRDIYISLKASHWFKYIKPYTSLYLRVYHIKTFTSKFSFTEPILQQGLTYWVAIFHVKTVLILLMSVIVSIMCGLNKIFWID